MVLLKFQFLQSRIIYALKLNFRNHYMNLLRLPLRRLIKLSYLLNQLAGNLIE